MYMHVLFSNRAVVKIVWLSKSDKSPLIVKRNNADQKVILASRDKYVRGANVIALPSASASRSVAWTKTLTLAITFKPEEIGLPYCT